MSWVELVEVRVRNMDSALTAGDSSAVIIERHLVRLHRVLIVTAVAVSPDAGSLVPLEHFHEALTSFASHTSGNTIRRNAVNPDDLICDLNAAALSSGSQGVTTATEHTWDCAYKVDELLELNAEQGLDVVTYLEQLLHF